MVDDYFGAWREASIGSRSHNDRSTRSGRDYLNNLSLIPEVEKNLRFSLEMLIEEIEKACGLNTSACVPKGSQRERYHILRNGLELLSMVNQIG